MKTRWAVSFINGDGGDDWQLMRNQETRYFENESEAREFMQTKTFKGKPFYWQPTAWREEEHVFSYPRWIVSRETAEVGK